VHPVTELSVLGFLRWLEATQVAVFVSQSPWGFPAIEMVHVTAIAVVVGMITIMDLRLLGLASVRRSVTDLYREVVPVTWGAFAVAATTGALMFISQPVKYYGNDAFRLKIALLILAAVNMLGFRFFTYRGVSTWDRDSAVPLAGKLAGAVSLLCWIAIVASARWTAYFML
jgi:uncharacterized protein DUF6644